MATQGLAGLNSLLATLDRVVGAQKKAARAGVKAGLVVLSRTVKKAIDGSSASPEVKRAAKRTIGNRLQTRQGKAAVGKAGFAVGKPTKRKREKATERAASDRAGVGISSSNVHWFVLGTSERKTERGAGRGKIDPVLDGVIDTAVSLATIPMLAAAKAKVSQVLAREAAKAKSKGR